MTPSRQPSEQTDSTPTHATTPACVAFVGSGPGDPGLMTLRGRDLLAAADVVAAVSVLDDPDTRACVEAERSLLSTLEAGCTAPVGALAEVVEGEDGLELSLRAFAGSEDGSVELRRSLVGPYDQPQALGSRLARILLEDGAADLQVATSAGPVPDHAPHQPEQVS